MKKFKFKGTKSEILDPIEFEGHQILSLKHGNTGHVLYLFPCENYEWEGCWTMDLETAKKGVLKFKKYLEETSTASV